MYKCSKWSSSRDSGQDVALEVWGGIGGDPDRELLVKQEREGGRFEGSPRRLEFILLSVKGVWGVLRMGSKD